MFILQFVEVQIKYRIFSATNILDRKQHKQK